MSQSEQQCVQDPGFGQYDGDDDRRRYQRRQGIERRQLIRFDLTHIKRRSGRDRRLLPTKQQSPVKHH
ncbi:MULTISPECIES: hypothetical protein [unclassified Methylophaga]|jgi:hypothetical protein|uniref:hypothetical protein n=1 Tax=unclassified Methylophaga TaxID=2629249 RepID=UPI000C95BB97|nr:MULTISPECIES: hypothetical protein [unclassified Methylophaga]MAK66572.1 hypothetical protein [Methylophaga sp.]MAY17549.1 hypothetical protein [Methylophaga sp.]MBN47492.1 hypothetical protein [Methylophaga sp.]HAO24156.1 hypothetical protein [Methylophaga sp.]